MDLSADIQQQFRLIAKLDLMFQSMEASPFHGCPLVAHLSKNRNLKRNSHCG